MKTDATNSTTDKTTTTSNEPQLALTVKRVRKVRTGISGGKGPEPCPCGTCSYICW